VEIPVRLESTVCGICGNYDGDSSNDYSLGPNDKASACPNQANTKEAPGTIIDDSPSNVQKYAISWLDKLDKEESRCLDDCGV